MKSSRARSIAVLLSLVALHARAWDNTGHQVVAQIAYDTITQDSPAAKAKLDAIVAADPRPLRKDLLICAIWPDLNKHRNEVKNPPPALFAGAPVESDWHFVDIPYEDTDAGAISDFIDMPGTKPNPAQPTTTGNVVVAIRYYSGLLKTSTSGSVGTDQNRADYVSWVVHYVGDVHQPLHCVNVTEQLSNYTPPATGDRGGNGFALMGLGKITELHALWDDQLDLDAKKKGTKEDAVNPDHAAIQTTATRLESAYPKSHFTAQLGKTDPKDWALESYSFRTNVYALTVDAPPPDPYLSFANATSEERITLAGYRLAAVLESALK